jgi:NAD-dependent dihydropyrimidine dehydrogenase PreA subunit
MEIAKSSKPILAKPKVKFLMLRYRNCGERLTITGSANDKSGGISNLTWDWFINFVVLGCLGLMSWERLNQILTPVISVLSIVSLFFIYFFRVNKWNISGPIFKLNALQELGQWRKIFKRENWFQMDETEPWEGGANRTLTANFVDCLSCGRPVPVRSEKCIQCGAPYLISTNS